MVDRLPQVIFIMGPTASGKTALSIALAHALNAEIISVDSALVYRGMDIGTAKPDVAERQGVPHHLIDILEPTETYSTGEFRDDALMLISDIVSRDKMPLLVGGTMLYFNALLRGLAVLPPSDPVIRASLESEFSRLGKQAMHARLKKIDPEAAARIHPNDPQRIQRALEVFAISGKPISSYYQQQNTRLPFRPVKFIVAPNERKDLHELIERRFYHMLEAGLIEEVRRLQNRGGLNETMPSMRAVGYRQVWGYLMDQYDYPSMIDKGVAATRQLAKRQFTWLRKEENAHWLKSEDQSKLEKVLKIIN